jgi:hypothetical protein
MDESGEGSDEEDTIDDAIVEQFIRTYHIGGYDVELDNALCYDRGVVNLPVRPTQASYTKPDDWVARNRIGLEKLKDQLQTCIYSVSHGTHQLHDQSLQMMLKHNGYGHQLTDNEEPIVWHEPILDGYWDRFEEQMRQMDRVTDISDIQIVNVEITKERLAAVVAILSNGRVTNLSTRIMFDNTNLCEEGIISMAKLVDVSSQLQTLFIHHNRIDNMESARCLSRSLKSHTCINRLWLRYCDLGSSPEMLLIILQSEVSIINLDNNNINSLGAVKIAEYLESDPPIFHIDLEHNRLNDDDAILISQALKRNTNLKEIRLHTNNFTSIGVKALLTCVFDSSSLNAISESNHTLLRIDFFDDFSPAQDERLNGCIKRLLELDRTQKILLALQDKDSLLQYLANVPLELIPEVLAFPLRQVGYQCEHKHLNVLYYTMRWWNMPMLYSYHNCVKSDAKRKRND